MLTGLVKLSEKWKRALLLIALKRHAFQMEETVIYDPYNPKVPVIMTMMRKMMTMVFLCLTLSNEISNVILVT